MSDDKGNNVKIEVTDANDENEASTSSSDSSGDDKPPVKNMQISWLRSEPMALCQIFLQHESAYQSVNLMGELGMTEFRDLNAEINAFQKKFVNELRRCDDMERQLSNDLQNVLLHKYL